jgi:drug/metabolite transporter (DMT)-like permease
MKWILASCFAVVGVIMLAKAFVAFQRHDIWAITGSAAKGVSISPVGAAFGGACSICCAGYLVFASLKEHRAQHDVSGDNQQ